MKLEPLLNMKIGDDMLKLEYFYSSRVKMIGSSKKKFIAWVITFCCLEMIARDNNGATRDTHTLLTAQFNNSMGFDRKTFREKRDAKYKHPLVSWCRERYIKNHLSDLHPQKDLIIPKIVHLIWIGPKNPPPVYYSCLESIKKHLPDWELKVWKDSDIPLLKLQNQKYYEEEPNFAGKSDIMRYELLYKFGGLYLDVDVVVAKPFDILHYTHDFYVGLHPSTCVDVLGSAILGSIPGHPILKHVIETFKDHRNRECQLARVGPIHLQEAFSDMVTKHDFNRIGVFPATYFYPIEPEDRFPNINEKQFIKQETFAAHFFANNWS